MGSEYELLISVIYLDKQQRAVQQAARSLDVEQQLIHARERRGALSPAASSSTNRASASASTNSTPSPVQSTTSLPPGPRVPQPPGERVVRHQRLAKRAADDVGRVAIVGIIIVHSTAVEEDERH
jgi:hypothetical protein